MCPSSGLVSCQTLFASHSYSTINSCIVKFSFRLIVLYLTLCVENITDCSIKWILEVKSSTFLFNNIGKGKMVQTELGIFTFICSTLFAQITNFTLLNNVKAKNDFFLNTPCFLHLFDVLVKDLQFKSTFVPETINKAVIKIGHKNSKTVTTFYDKSCVSVSYCCCCLFFRTSL